MGSVGVLDAVYFNHRKSIFPSRYEELTLAEVPSDIGSQELTGLAELLHLECFSQRVGNI